MGVRSVARRIGVQALALFVLVSTSAVQARADATGRRVALVVGNAGYEHVSRLGNPGHDATLIATTLRSLGFKLVGDGAQIDLDKMRLDQALQAFGDAIIGADVALLYYSGHGLQVQGTNWLAPVDANPTRVQDLDFQMVSVDVVLHQMEAAGTRLNVLILDACRNNPFGGRGLRAAGGGLAQMQAPEGTLISYATQPGNIAFDGSGADSPFALALASALRQPGLDIFQMFNAVGVAVKRQTGGAQQPWVSNSPIEGDFYFAGTADRPTGQAAGSVPAAPAASSKPAWEVANRLAKLGLPALPFAQPAEPPAQTPPWHQFHSESGEFLVLLPGEPNETIEPADANGHRQTRYQVDVGNASYVVVVDEFPPAGIAALAPTRTLDVTEQALLKITNGTATRRRPITMAGFPGREILLDTPDHSGKVRFYVVRNRLYTIAYASPRGDRVRPDADIFLDSFQLTSR